MDRKSIFAALTGFVVCAVLAFAAPIPETERDAREKLEALKKRLPKLLDGFLEEAQSATVYMPEVLAVRRLGPSEAKLNFAFRYAALGKRDATLDHYLTVFLRYYDGAWISAGMQTSWPAAAGSGWGAEPTRAAHLLLLDIDSAR
jgi:hypothetical protein